MKRASAAGGLILLCAGCSVDPGELPPPRTGGLGSACYPVQFVRPAAPPILRDCEVADPDAAVVVMDVGADGRVRKASFAAQATEATTGCLTEALQPWRLEPARDCMGEPRAGRYELTYRQVFGWKPCLPPVPDPSLPGVRTADGIEGARKETCG